MSARPKPVRAMLVERVRNRFDMPAFAALAVLLIIGSLAIFAPILPLHDPNATDLGARLLPPLSGEHWLGTDRLGRDLLSRLVWGTRVSLGFALAAAVISAMVGSVIGILAGARGGFTDMALMRSIDILMAFPYLLLALAIVAILGPGLFNAMVAIAVVNIPFFARVVRGATIAEMSKEYVLAARALGLSETRLMWRHILPNVLSSILVAMAATTGWMIVETAGLSFLGLGTQPPQADLGSMLGDGTRTYIVAPHVATLPGLTIGMIVVAANILADGLRSRSDRRSGETL